MKLLYQALSLFSLFILPPPPLAGQEILHGPLVTNLTHSTARVTFITSADPQNSDVAITRTGMTPRIFPAARVTSTPFTSTALLTGLTPGTTYQLAARLNSGAIVSREITFSTPSEPDVHPELPVDPQPVEIAMPAGDYGDSSELAVHADCSNLNEILRKLTRLSGDQHYEVVLPMGAECRGQFEFPARPNHNGWVVVRSAIAGTDGYAPEGTRFHPVWQGATARFIGNALPVSIATQPSFLPNGPCDTHSSDGGYAYVSILPTSMFPVYVCRNSRPEYAAANRITGITGHITLTVTAPGHQLAPGDVIRLSDNGYAYANQAIVESVDGDRFLLRPLARIGANVVFDPSLNPTFTVNPYWKPAPHTSGESLPETCSQEDWFFRPATGEIFWCTAPNQWRLFRPVNPFGDPHAAILVPANARRYRFIGLEVTHERMPEPLPAGWDRLINGGQPQGVYRQLISSYGDEIVWDRCYVHGWPYPQRLMTGFALAGKNVAIVNSYIDEVSWWRSSGYNQNEGGNGILHLSDGPALIDNNYIAVAGIGYFAPNNNLQSQVLVHDVTFTRNTMRVYPKWRLGDPENNGVVYSHRNHWELKQGARFRVEGNQFEYGFSGLTAGQFLLLTPRCSSLPPAVNVTSIANGLVTLASSLMLSSGDVVALTGTDSPFEGVWEIAAAECEAGQCRRFWLKDAPPGAALQGRLFLRASNRGISDVLMQWNTFREGTELLRVTGTTGCGFSHLPATRRIALRNNESTDLNIRPFSRGGRVDRDGTYRNGDFGARTVLNLGWLEDLTVTDNLFNGNRGNMPLLLGTELVSEGLNFSGNTFTFDEDMAFRAVFHSNALGVEALNRGYRRDDRPNWIFENNVICCGLDGYSGAYPPSTQWPGRQAARRNATERALYAALRPAGLPLAAEAHRKRELAARQGRVLDARVEEVTPTGAVIRYTAPDAFACTLEFGESQAWGTGRRLRDGGGNNRERAVRLVSLKPHTQYHYRLLCAAEQPSGAFRTQ
ncbi:MAG: fibronectin type III domain-containing protein [Bryobacteraceae bacterium]|nr:fibronectin type III domain-containing protein [Bryobacteraceae bacterium]